MKYFKKTNLAEKRTKGHLSFLDNSNIFKPSSDSLVFPLQTPKQIKFTFTKGTPRSRARRHFALLRLSRG